MTSNLRIALVLGFLIVAFFVGAWQFEKHILPILAAGN